MKTYTFCLTSSKLPPIQPDIVDHYLFTDPARGLDFTYGQTDDGSYLLSAVDVRCLIPACAVTDTCTTTADGTQFFPWGYRVQTESTKFSLPDFKGDTTVTFNPSCLDIQYHDVTKIIYNFAGETVTVERPVLLKQVSFSLDNFTLGSEVESPTRLPVSHTFTASVSPITYTTSVTAFYMDMTFVFFEFTCTVYPNSIYDIDNVHLVASSQIPSISGADLNVLEIESESQVVSTILNRL